MDAQYKLWKVTIHYEAHHIDGNSKVTSFYQLPGRTKEEALEKARALFSEQEGEGTEELIMNGRYKCKEITLDNYVERIRELRTPMPTLSGPDAGKFTIEPRLSKDGRNIEYIVQENK